MTSSWKSILATTYAKRKEKKNYQNMKILGINMSYNMYEYTCENWKVILNRNLIERKSNLLIHYGIS